MVVFTTPQDVRCDETRAELLRSLAGLQSDAHKILDQLEAALRAEFRKHLAVREAFVPHL